MRRHYPSIATALTAIIAQACGLVTSGHDAPDSGSQAAGSAGQASGGTTAASGGTSVNAPGVVIRTDAPSDCPTDILFADQVVDQVGESRIFYSWTTDEQVAELRGGTELFSRSERPGMGRGLLFTELAVLATSGNAAENELANVLVNQTFAKARFAWPNPWATLLGLPGETYGNQLLRVELKAEAWVARFDGGALSVLDANNQLVPLETALANPERIGAIFYQSRASGQSTYSGSFSRSCIDFREFALGNIEMVERWSLATPEIAERLDSDIRVLKAFEAEVACVRMSSSWSHDTACEWNSGVNPNDLISSYDFALGLPSDLYLPNPENIAALIAALEMSLPTGEPLVVTPGQ